MANGNLNKWKRSRRTTFLGLSFCLRLFVGLEASFSLSEELSDLHQYPNEKSSSLSNCTLFFSILHYIMQRNRINIQELIFPQLLFVENSETAKQVSLQIKQFPNFGLHTQLVNTITAEHTAKQLYEWNTTILETVRYNLKFSNIIAVNTERWANNQNACNN